RRTRTRAPRPPVGHPGARSRPGGPRMRPRPSRTSPEVVTQVTDQVDDELAVREAPVAVDLLEAVQVTTTENHLDGLAWDDALQDGERTAGVGRVRPHLDDKVRHQVSRPRYPVIQSDPLVDLHDLGCPGADLSGRRRAPRGVREQPGDAREVP